jgi:hypothetical protein
LNRCGVHFVLRKHLHDTHTHKDKPVGHTHT